jgi:hypothetical protein
MSIPLAGSLGSFMVNSFPEAGRRVYVRMSIHRQYYMSQVIAKCAIRHDFLIVKRAEKAAKGNRGF